MPGDFLTFTISTVTYQLPVYPITGRAFRYCYALARHHIYLSPSRGG